MAIAVLVLVAGGIGYFTYLVWPWAFPRAYEFTSGEVEGLQIGAEKATILDKWPNADLQAAPLDGHGGWIKPLSATPAQKGRLVASVHWELSGGLSVCGKGNFCPGMQARFDRGRLIRVQVVCHLCP